MNEKGGIFMPPRPGVTEALLRYVRFRGPIWEPCCGTGAMSTVLAARGCEVVSTDIADRGIGEAGVGFFHRTAVPSGCHCIVTSPPYGDTVSHVGQEKSSAAMLRFVRHAISLAEAADGQLALLVRLQWIAGWRAAELMLEARFSAVITLMQRIRWFDMGADTNTAQHEPCVGRVRPKPSQGSASSTAVRLTCWYAPWSGDNVLNHA